MVVTVNGLTKERMEAIEAESVTGGAVDGAYHLILTKHDGSTIDAGYVRGPDGPPYTNGVDTVSDQTIGGLKTFSALTKFDAGIRVGDGAYNAPSMSFENNTDMGFYRPGAGILGGIVPSGGRFSFRDWTGTEKAKISDAGQLFAVGNDTLLGPYALGSGVGVSRTKITNGASSIGIYAEGDGVNRDFEFRVKGASSFLFREEGGTNLVQIVQSTGGVVFSKNPGSTLESNRQDTRTIINAASIGIASDFATHQGSQITGLAISMNRGTPAITVNNAGGDVFRGYSGTTQKSAIASDGSVISAGGTSYFGHNTLGASGPRIALQADNADPTNVYMRAEGTGTNVNIGLRTKGSGAIMFQNNSPANVAWIDTNTGGMWVGAGGSFRGGYTFAARSAGFSTAIFQNGADASNSNVAIGGGDAGLMGIGIGVLGIVINGATDGIGGGNMHGRIAFITDRTRFLANNGGAGVGEVDNSGNMWMAGNISAQTSGVSIGSVSGTLSGLDCGSGVWFGRINGTDIGLYSSSAQKMVFDGTGNVKAKGVGHLFGPKSWGTGSEISIFAGSGANDVAGIIARNSGGNATLVLQSSGGSSTRFDDGDNYSLAALKRASTTANGETALLLSYRTTGGSLNQFGQVKVGAAGTGPSGSGQMLYIP